MYIGSKKCIKKTLNIKSKWPDRRKKFLLFLSTTPFHDHDQLDQTLCGTGMVSGYTELGGRKMVKRFYNSQGKIDEVVTATLNETVAQLVHCFFSANRPVGTHFSCQNFRNFFYVSFIFIVKKEDKHEEELKSCISN